MSNAGASASAFPLPRQRLIGPFPPPTGGVAVAALTVRRALEGAGYEVECFDTSAHAAREDIYRARGGGAVLRNLSLVARLSRWHRAGARPDDVFHVFVTSDRAFARDEIFLRLLRAARCRIIVHLHSKTAGEYWVEPGRLDRFGRGLSLGGRVIVLSEGHRDFFARHVAPAKLAVLENFVISADFEAPVAAPATRFLYLSRISEMKGTWELLRAAAELVKAGEGPSFQVTIAGTCDTDRTQSDMQAFVAASGLGGVVTFAGHVEGAAKTALFRDHGVFVFPSRFENSPITLKEATQAGMAVVASDIRANADILDRTGNAVYFTAGDPEALARRMAAVMADAALYARLREAARAGAKFDEHYALPVIRDIIRDLRAG